MKLEFKTYKLNENSKTWQTIINVYKKAKKRIPDNMFVVVGEREDYYLAQHDDILVIADIEITETSYMIKKEDLTLIPNQYVEYDIPRKNLTMNIIEEIQRLNEV